MPALQISLEALRWTDSEAVTKVTSFCRAIILLAIFTDNAELLDYVCKNLFQAIIEGLTLESNAFISADLVGLCREIFVYLSDRDPAPRQVFSQFFITFFSNCCSKHLDSIAFLPATDFAVSSKH